VVINNQLTNFLYVSHWNFYQRAHDLDEKYFTNI
jgi:hypothetical protein